MTDIFDLYNYQNVFRNHIMQSEQFFFNHIKKEKRKIKYDFKQKQIKIKSMINNYINHLLNDQQEIITKKHNLLNNSIDLLNFSNIEKIEFKSEILNDISTNRIVKLFYQKQNLLQRYFLKTIYLGNSGQACLICYDLINKLFLIKCFSCVACYHEDCINKWLEINNRCPMCRNQTCYYKIIDNENISVINI